MTLVETPTSVDDRAIADLVAEEQRRSRLLESEMAWDRDLARAMWSRWPRLASGSPGPLSLMQWPGAPSALNACLDLWAALPAAVDRAIGGRWPGRADADERTEARVALLALRCATDNERRAGWLGNVKAPIDPYAIALLRDRVTWVSTDRQLYGTLSTLLPAGARPRVAISDPDRLHARRSDLGLPALGDDAARGVTEVGIIGSIGRRAAGA